MNDLRVKISYLEDDVIVEMMDDLYECLYVTGYTREGSFLRHFIEENKCNTFDNVKEALLDVVADRFDKVFYLLLNNRMYRFAKPIE